MTKPLKWNLPTAEVWRSWRIPPAKTEVYFDDDRRFRFDFGWPQVKVAIEKQGGIWRRGGGAHTGRGHLRDMAKINLAQSQGWMVLQFTPEQMFTKDMLDVVREVLAKRGLTV